MRSFKDFIIMEEKIKNKKELFDYILNDFEAMFHAPMFQGELWCDEDYFIAFISDDYSKGAQNYKALGVIDEKFIDENWKEILKYARKKWTHYKILGVPVFSFGASKEEIKESLKDYM